MTKHRLAPALAVALACGACAAGTDDEAADRAVEDASAAPLDSADVAFSITGLAGPESVRYDPDQDIWFIANFGEAADDERDENGFITRAAADGTVEELRFMEGTAVAPLHMPRGMYIEGDTLWAADIDGVHGFDRRTGEQLAFIDFTAHEPGFLNDVATGPDGTLYVTDTGRARVYAVAGAGAEPSVAVEDTLTGPPNGITWDPTRSAFLLAPWGGGRVIRAWAPGGSSLEEAVTVPAGGRFDGIEVVDGAILAASQEDTSLWWAESGAAPRQIVITPGAPADIGVDTRRDRVAVPYIALDRVDVWALPGR
ncbi:MAG: SMP-30/gluconolactonase/LRE family protein [Gemmatimonadota bacterium]